MTAQDFAERLNRCKKTANGWQGQCPAHDDHVSSLCVAAGDDERVLVKCQAGCEVADIVAAMGLKMFDLFPAKQEEIPTAKLKQRIQGKAIATYTYIDADGAILYEVLRYINKGFSQRSLDKNGNWINRLGDTKLVPYRLPAIKDAIKAGKPIYIVEGEKDVHTMESIGLVATCNSGGAGKWKDCHSQYLADAKVVILHDNDTSGKNHSVAVAKSLSGIAGMVKIVDLPDLPAKGDVTDWISAGGTKQGLLSLAKKAPIWRPETTETQINSLPEIVIGNRQQRDVTNEVIDALNIANDPPRLFIRSGQIVRLRTNDDGVTIIDSIAIDIIRNLMSASADFIKYTHKGEPINTYPPIDNARDVLALGEWPFPQLAAVTTSPVIRKDGSIMDVPGYDKSTKLYYMPEAGFDIGKVPSKPTADDISKAKDLIYDVLADFPFVSPSDYANAVGLMLTPIVRSAVDDCIPLAIVNAPQPGAGKGLLTNIINIITTGRTNAMMTAPNSSEEWRKSITSKLLEGASFVLIDNVESKLHDASLASVLTVTAWSDRLLGTNKTVDIPNMATWVATGNNIKLGGDIPRRCYWININPRTSRPELRSGFRHSNIKEYCKRKRGTLVNALLILIRHWYASGCPIAKTPIIGSFEQWSKTVGGILEICDINGFLANAEDARRKASDDEDGWEAFLNALADQYQDSTFTTHKVNQDMDMFTNLVDALPDNLAAERLSKNSSFVRKLGNAFSRNDGKCYGENNIQIEKTGGTFKQKTIWRVVTIQCSRSGIVMDSYSEPHAHEKTTEYIDEISEIKLHASDPEITIHNYVTIQPEELIDDDETVWED